MNILRNAQFFYCDTPHTFAGAEHFSWPVTTTWPSSVIRVCAEVHFHLAPPVQYTDSLEQELTKRKNCCCLQLCLQGPAGQEVLFSWECLVKMTDFYINSVGHKFSANSKRAFKPKQLLAAQIILNISSVLCTLFPLHSDLHLPTTIS